MLHIKRYFNTRIIKKFYQNVNIIKNDDLYNICLDGKCLKSPYGKILKTNSEGLAHAIVQEWISQKDIIDKSNMHFTTMLNMSLDNPQKLSKDALITSLLSFLENDTLCYRNDGEELYMLQSKLWDPLIDWFEKRFNVKVNSTVTLLNPITDSNSKERLTRHLFSHSFEVLTGYKYSCEASRSLIITCALMEGTIDSEKAANLALLEQNFQIQKWGNVEWSHDIHECDVISRLASSYIFCHFNQEISNIQSIS